MISKGAFNLKSGCENIYKELLYRRGISMGGMGQVRSSLVERKLLVLIVLKGAFNLKTRYEYIYWELLCSLRDVSGLIQDRLGALW
jgi:hypothetical protein